MSVLSVTRELLDAVPTWDRHDWQIVGRLVTIVLLLPFFVLAMAVFVAVLLIVPRSWVQWIAQRYPGEPHR